MLEPQDRTRFEQVMLPHLNSATNLARWSTRILYPWGRDAPNGVCLRDSGRL